MKTQHSIVWGICAVVGAGPAGGCGGLTSTDDTGQQSKALTSANQRIFGFESLSDWTVTSGTKTLSDQHTQGIKSLELTSTGYVAVTSAKIVGPIGAGSLLGFDVIIPHLQSPNWNGQATVTLNAPSRGIYNVSLPGKQFAFPYTTFQRMQIALPTDIVTKLNQSYSDLQIEITLTGGAGQYFVDNLRFVTAVEAQMPVARANTDDIMNMEDPDLWVSYAPAVLGSSSRATGGAHSISVSNIGWTRLDSAPMSRPRTLGPYIAFNLLLPTPQANPSWCGSVDLVASIPSAGLRDLAVGHKELTGLPLNHYQRVQFAVPANLLTALGGTYNDLSFGIVMNMPAGTSGSYLVDNLRFRPDGTSGNDPEVQPVTVAPPSFTPPPVIDVPPLTGTGLGAVQSVRKFIDWAITARSSQMVSARLVIHAASDNKDIANALTNEFNLQAGDFARNIVVLSVLGELKSPTGQTFLQSVVDLPNPSSDRGLGMLQAKAIDGIAHMRSAVGNQKLRQVIATSPSSALRVEAIRAYLANNGAAGRAELVSVVSPREQIFLDVFPNVNETDRTITHDQALQQFLAKHPEQAGPFDGG